MPLLFADNPLLYAIALLLVDVVLWRLIPSDFKHWKLCGRLAVFLLYSKVLFSAGMNPLEAAPWPDDLSRHLLATVLEIIWWLYCARTLTILIATLFMPRVGHKGRLLQDVLGAVIFSVAIIAAIAYVMQLPVKGVLATSGAVAIIVGLALQSTLSDVFSGIVLNTTKPYQLDDWISIDGTEGKVIEIDWRSTHLLTGQGSLAIIPNSLAAKAKVMNLSRPSDVHGIAISLELSPEARPRTVLEALDRAIKGCSELLDYPTPGAALKKAGAVSIEYEISGFVRSMTQKGKVRNLLYDLAYRHLAAAGVPLQNLSMQTPALTLPRQRLLLEGISIFRALNDEEKTNLSAKMVRHEYPAGQVVIAFGELTDYLLIIESGVLSVALPTGETAIEAGRMGPGEVIGEAGVISNAPISAQLSTLTPTVLYRIEKADLLPCLQAREEVGDALSNLLSFRDQASSTLLALQNPQPIEHSGFLGWLRKRMGRGHELH